MLKNVVEVINHELKNGLIYVVIEDYCTYYKSYEPITINSDGTEINICDEDNNHITLHHKAIQSIKVAEV